MKAIVKVTRTTSTFKIFEVEIDDKELSGKRYHSCLQDFNNKALQMAADMEFSDKDSQYHSSVVEITEAHKEA